MTLEGNGKIGLATSKKIGSKPRRNFVKRRLRMTLQRYHEMIDSRLDYIWIASPTAAVCDFQRIDGEAFRLLSITQEKWEKQRWQKEPSAE